MSNLELYTNLQTSDTALANVERMGAAMCQSGMFGCTRREQGTILAIACITMGMSPLDVANKYHIIDGKLSKKAGAALAEFKARGGKYKWLRTGQEPDQDQENLEAVGEFTLDGETITVRFDMAMARKAGLVRAKSAWETFPWKMLRARVESDAIGMLAPEIYFGDDDFLPSSPQPQQPVFGAKPEQSEEQNPEPKRGAQTSSERKPETTTTSRFDPEAIQDAEEIPAETVPDSGPQPDNGKQKAGDGGSPEAAETVEPDDGDGEGYKGDLNPAILQQLKKILRNDMRKSLIYMRAIGYIKADEGLGCLSEFHARAIIDRHQSFLENARKSVA